MLFGWVLLAQAQLDQVYIYGNVKDQYTSKKLDGVTVTILKNGAKLNEVKTNASGKYEVNLDYGADYSIVFNRANYISKNISIDTRNVPEEDRTGGHAINMDMSLFEELPGVDFSLLKQPFGKARYDATKKDLAFDFEYTAQIRNELNRLIKDYTDRKKLEGDSEAQFARLMQTGEAAMTAADYRKAVDSFTAALGLKPNDPKATARLSDAKMKLDDIEGDKKKNEQYAALIKEADALFTKKEWENAKAKYAQALTIKELEAHPKQRVKECDTLIAEAAKRADEERKAKELEEKYKGAIAAADLAFKSEKYEEAKTKYQEAVVLKPTEKYPKDQLALVDQRMVEAAKKAEEEKKRKELDAQYLASITAADAAFKAGNWETARTKYTDAAGLKPAEKYPKDQLAAIDKAVADAAKKAEEEKKAKELEDKYKAALAKADASFNAGKYEEAKVGYNEALVVKPAEKYPKDQIAAADKAMADAAKKSAADQKERELNEQYQAAITEADDWFRKEQWESAKAKYNQAASLKPQEKYPKDQLLAIDKAMADASKRADEARKAKELEEKYQVVIGSADALFKKQQWEQAKAKYSEARTLKPDEKYPVDQLAAIESALAEAARAAEEEKRRKELDAQYEKAIATGDKAHASKKLTDALNAYKDALRLKPEERYPADKVAEIERTMDAEARDKAEKERAEREAKDALERFNSLMTAGDKAFQAKQYADARSAYTDASTMRPEEKRPRERLAEIDRILDEERRQADEARLKAERDAAERARLEEEKRRKELEAAGEEAKYRDLIARADVAFSNERWDQAREGYTAAVAMRSTDPYPVKQLGEIERLIAERERQRLDAERMADEHRRSEEERRRQAELDAEAARLAADDERRKLEEEKAREAQYRQAVLQGDEAMGAKEYEQARGHYAMALDIKPHETYPQAKMEQIDKILEEIARREREAQERATAQQPVATRKRANTTIDMRKEEEAERFMREAREREEAEKYERVRQQRTDLEEQEAQRQATALARREQSQQDNTRMVESGPGLYRGSDDGRLAGIEAVIAQKEALAMAEEQRRDAAAERRDHAVSTAQAQVGASQDSHRTWTERQQELADAVRREQDAQVARQGSVATSAGERTTVARQQVEAQQLAQERVQQRGDLLADRNKDVVADEKQMHANREAQLMNRSQDRRMSAQEQLAGLPSAQQRAMEAHPNSRLATEYPPGVTEESYTEGNKVIIRRVVVQGNRADEYSKVIARWGTFYFKNGQSISEHIWNLDTDPSQY
ncbi:MAG: hypothetical protein JNM31_01165 [Flavobacteriales bacterium]|nr:hypothetical protein [Flavobacteriales bacterium]